MKLFGPLLWYHSELLKIHYDYHSDVSTFEGSRIEEIQSRKFPYEVFEETLADGILVSKTLLLHNTSIENEEGKCVIKRHGETYSNIRKYTRIPNHYYTFADPGTWSYVYRFELPDYLYDTDGMVDYYNDLDFDLAGSVDWPIVDRLRVNRKGKTRFFEAPDKIKKKRVGITLELAQDFINRCGRRNINFIPFGTAQGYDIASYKDSVRRICKMGYEYIAVGGMPAYSEKQVLELLPIIWEEVKKCGSRPGFHLYGRYPSPTAVASFLKYGVTSIDNNSNFLTAVKTPCPYYAPEFASFSSCPTDPCRGLHLPPSNSPTFRRIKRDDPARYRAVDRLCRRAFFLYSRFSKDGREIDKRNFLKVYESLMYSLNRCLKTPRSPQQVKKKYEQAIAIVDEKPWRMCKCTSCRKLKGHAVMTRGPRNPWMSAHNAYTTYARFSLEMSKVRRDRRYVTEPFYDYERLDKFVADKIGRRKDVD